MAGLVYRSLVLCICVVSVSAWWPGLRLPEEWCPRSVDHKQVERCSICNWFSSKTVTLRVRNVWRQPTFDEKVTLRCTKYKTLFYMMQEAAEANTIFRFSVKYFGSELGFSVQGINNLFGNYTLDKSYWEILDGYLSQTPVGVSSYMPRNGETVTFNFTQYGGH